MKMQHMVAQNKKVKINLGIPGPKFSEFLFVRANLWVIGLAFV